MTTKKFDIIGMTCASCAQSIDHVLKQKEGIHKANINLATDTAFITYDENILTIENVIETIESAGFDATLKNDKLKTLTLRVEGMTCATCAGNVDHAVKDLEGVNEVT